MSLKSRAFMTAYPYRKAQWTRSPALGKPLQEARVALVTSAALYLPDQPPFDGSVKGGDFSYRVIPKDVDLSTAIDGHRSKLFDHSGLEQDRQLILPIERLNELEKERVIGSVADSHYSFMGGLTAPGRFLAKSAPEITARMKSEAIDAALLVPV